MKKLMSLMLAIALVLAVTSSALALDIPAGKISLSAEPVDYTYAKTGYAQPVSKAYVANERFAVLVTIDIPKYMDTAGLTIEVTPKGCTVKDVGALALVTGDYLITGMVLTPGATVKITIKDNALENFSSPAEFYAAVNNDRTVSATATLGVAAAIQTVGIPKTGDPVSIGGAAVCLLLAAALMWRRRNA